MGLALAHAMEVEPRFDREPPAFERPRRLAIEDFPARSWRRLRRDFWRLPRRRLIGLGRFALWPLLGAIRSRDRPALGKRPRATGHALPQLFVTLVSPPAHDLVIPAKAGIP